MVNPWITYVRQYSIDNDISYGCALSLREVRLGYQKQKLEKRIAERERKRREEERLEQRRRDPASAKAEDAIERMLLSRKQEKGEKKVDDAIRKAREKAREKAETKRLLDTKLVPKRK
jgi:hypothetical protein